MAKYRPVAGLMVSFVLVACGGSPAATTDASPTTTVASTIPVTSSTTTTTTEAITTSSYQPLEVVPLTAAAIERAAEVERVVREYHAAWESKDLEALAALLADEFVFGDPGLYYLSKEEFLSDFGGFSPSGPFDLRFFVGGDELIQRYWDWGFGRMETVNRIDVRDGKITSIVSMLGGPVPIDLVDAYLAAWSSGDPAQVEALYAETAVRVEALYGVELQGSTEIARYAAGFFQRHGDAALTIIEPFVFRRADDTWEPNVGAVFSLVNAAGCSVHVAVLLEGDASGAVTSERVYYNLDTVQACDWQR